MDKSNTVSNIFKIFYKSTIIYVKNLIPLTWAMLFPVLGQLIGAVLIFYPTYLYKVNYMSNLSPEYIQHSMFFILLGLFIIILPGLFIFMKAFWEYMIIMVSINMLISDIEHKGDMGELKYHSHNIKKKSGDYIALLTIITLFWLAITVLPILGLLIILITIQNIQIFNLFMFISYFVAIFILIKLSLAFQVFAFEEMTPMQTIMKSWNLTRQNFWRTLLIGFGLLLVTNLIFPLLVSNFISTSSLMNYLVIPFQSYIDLFKTNPELIELLANILRTEPSQLAHIFVISTIQILIASFMLPMGSACFTLLYFDISARQLHSSPDKESKYKINE